MQPISNHNIRYRTSNNTGNGTSDNPRNTTSDNRSMRALQMYRLLCMYVSNITAGTSAYFIHQNLRLWGVSDTNACVLAIANGTFAGATFDRLFDTELHLANSFMSACMGVARSRASITSTPPEKIPDFTITHSYN